MESQLDWHSAKALLDWQLEMGADEAILDAPVDRYALPEASKPAPKQPIAHPQKAQARSAVDEINPVEEARQIAKGAQSLAALEQGLAGFDKCELLLGARNLVFCDGHSEAPVMIIGEAPGRDEDLQGKPFVGRAGHLLDKMFKTIALSRCAQDPSEAVYITNVLPWRPPQNRDPSVEEIDMMRPFLMRHIELAAPQVIVLMGNIACQAVLQQRGIRRLRGQFQKWQDIPVLPMYHPAYLLRNPLAKRDAWHDLLLLRQKMGEM